VIGEKKRCEKGLRQALKGKDVGKKKEGGNFGGAPSSLQKKSGRILNKGGGVGGDNN